MTGAEIAGIVFPTNYTSANQSLFGLTLTEEEIMLYEIMNGNTPSLINPVNMGKGCKALIPTIKICGILTSSAGSKAVKTTGNVLIIK